MLERKLIKKGIKRLAALFITLLLVLATQSMWTVWAFKPKNSLRATPADHTHQSITEEVIRALDAEFFGATTLTKSMTKALQEIIDANAGVDLGTSFFSADHHFDDEHFAGGQAVVTQAFQDIKDALNNKNAGGARSKLGEGLHTLQDFYSHSNWVELGNTVSNPSLAHPGQTIGNTSLPGEKTCNGCTPCVDCFNNLVTSGLTSGYFGVILSSKPAGKCSHGGPGDRTGSTAPTGGINKDTVDCTTSPHNARHNDAASLARQATEQFIRSLKAEMTPRQLKLLFGVGPTLTISIDTTGSMGDIIGSVKAQAIQIVNSRLGTDEEPSKYVLAPFNDPDVPPPTVTDDPDVFKAAISALFASGGGDCPELSMTGMFNGLGASDEGGDLFMFTDASSKDAAKAGDVESLAISKDIKIFPFVFGSCSPIDPSYVRVATNSGGQFFFLARSEAGSITRLADEVVRSNAVDLLSIGDVLAGSSKSYTVPVDATLTKVSFSVSGTTNVAIRRPDGSTVASTDPNVTFVPLTSGLLVSVAGPAPGAWSVGVDGIGTFSLLVSGESRLRLASFRFVRLAGRPGHDGFFPIEGLPLAGQDSTADAVMDGSFSSAEFELRSKVGTVLQVLGLTRGTGVAATEFLGNVNVPTMPFLAYVTGSDSTGKAYQRVLPAVIQPASLRVTPPTPHDLRPGQTTTYVFQVTNQGPPDTFQVTGSDDQMFLRSISPGSVMLNTNETANVTLLLQPQLTVRPGTSDTLTVTAQSPTSGARNFAVLTSFVVTNRPPDVSQARSSVSVLWPPNHNFVPVMILGVTDPDGDPVTIQIDRIMQDEPTNGLGDGDTCPDGLGVGTSTAQLRAERSGTRNGRVYTIFFTATDGRGGSASGNVKVAVPHDKAHDAVDDGPNFDSTACP